MATGRIVSMGPVDDILDEYQSILHGTFPRMATSVEPIVLMGLPALGTATAAELSLGAVKALREDVLATGLWLAVPGAIRAAE